MTCDMCQSFIPHTPTPILFRLTEQPARAAHNKRCCGMQDNIKISCCEWRRRLNTTNLIVVFSPSTTGVFNQRRTPNSDSPPIDAMTIHPSHSAMTPGSAATDHGFG